jgi:hypothetical protein
MATTVDFYLSTPPGDSMVVLGANVDANTIAGLAARRKLSDHWDGVRWAPVPPWGAVKPDGSVERIREQSDGAKCVVSEGVAHYTSRIFKAVDIPLPANPLRISLGSGSTAPAEGVGQGAPPPATPPPAAPAGPAPSPGPAGGLKAASRGGCLLAPLLALQRLFSR